MLSDPDKRSIYDKYGKVRMFVTLYLHGKNRDRVPSLQAGLQTSTSEMMNARTLFMMLFGGGKFGTQPMLSIYVSIFLMFS